MRKRVLVLIVLLSAITLASGTIQGEDGLSDSTDSSGSDVTEQSWPDGTPAAPAQSWPDGSGEGEPVEN